MIQNGIDGRGSKIVEQVTPREDNNVTLYYYRRRRRRPRRRDFDRHTNGTRCVTRSSIIKLGTFLEYSVRIIINLKCLCLYLVERVLMSR